MPFPRTVFVPSENRRPNRPEVISNLFTGRKTHIRIYFISISLRYAARSFGRFMTENRWQSARKIKKNLRIPRFTRARCGKRNTNNKTLQHRPPGTEIYGRTSRTVVVIDPGRIRNRKISGRVRPTPPTEAGRKRGRSVLKSLFPKARSKVAIFVRITVVVETTSYTGKRLFGRKIVKIQKWKRYPLNKPCRIAGVMTQTQRKPIKTRTWNWFIRKHTYTTYRWKSVFSDRINWIDIDEIGFSSKPESFLVNYPKKYYTKPVAQRNYLFFQRNDSGKIVEITVITGPVIEYIIPLIVHFSKCF